jgi:DNA-binding transcriptional regulator YdaS (Cro superfamily)
MDKDQGDQRELLAYLNALPPSEQVAFATRCKTTVGYLRKAISIKQPLREGLCIDIERESGRRVLCEMMRPDVDWEYLRNSAQAADERMAQEAINPLQQELGFQDRRRPDAANPFPDLDRRAAGAA